MIIEKDLIKKAKEKLGNRNAELIAEILGLPDFDTKNLKSCCPYHSEKTPSFIYNPKKQDFHCFGCGKTVDLIDVQVEKGKSFLDATKFLFEQAGIEYSFGEQSVKTRRNYRYPHEEPDRDKSNVYDYLNKRKISKDVIDYLDIREDKNGNCVFNYYDTNDVLSLVKYRPSHKVEKGGSESKTWCQKNADTTPLLFNMNRVNTQKPLLIAEGECFTGDTEVLTPNGWLKLSKYKDQAVLQVDGNFRGSFVKPTARIAKKYSGDLYTYNKDGNFSLTTTANHNWVYVDCKGRTVKKKICDFPRTIDGGYLPTSVYFDGKGIDLSTPYLALWLAISAIGTIKIRKSIHYNCCGISFRNQRRAKRFEEILNKCKLPYKKRKTTTSRVLFFVKIPKWITKELPQKWINDATIEQRKFIISETVNWSGDKIPNRNRYEYRSKVPHNAIWMQTMAHTCGYMSAIEEKHNNVEKWYKVSVLLNKKGVSFQHGISEISHYKGMVYCVSVPTGMILVRHNGHICVCGNCDCASAIEAGYLNTVSVPFGAGNFTWIEENWDFLNQFDSIIIWSDNDEAGLKMRKECLYRLGTWRTKFISTPEYYEKEGKRFRTTDINECLFVGGKEYVMDLISKAQDMPITSVVDYSEIEELDVSRMDGVKTGIKPIDEGLIKLFYGTLTILSGTPGSGKTSLIDQTIARSIDEDNPVFLFSKEMPERMSASWFNSILAGRRNMCEKESRDGRKYYVVPYSTQERMQKFYAKKLFIYRDDEPNDVESVMKSTEECVRKYGCKLIVLDNLMMLDLHCSENDKNTAQTNLINMLIKFAAKFNVAVVLIAHPRKIQDANTDIGLYDIAGTSNIINLAMRSISLRRVPKKERSDPKSPWKDYDVVLTVMKDRLLGKTDLQVGLWYDIISRRFYTDYDEYDTQYKWDDAVYNSKLPYTDRRSQDEDFPDD